MPATFGEYIIHCKNRWVSLTQLALLRIHYQTTVVCEHRTQSGEECYLLLTECRVSTFVFCIDVCSVITPNIISSVNGAETIRLRMGFDIHALTAHSQLMEHLSDTLLPKDVQYLTNLSAKVSEGDLAEVMSTNEQRQQNQALFQHFERAQDLAEGDCDTFLLLPKLVPDKVSELSPIPTSFQVPAQSLLIKQSILRSKHDAYISQMTELIAVVRSTNVPKGSFERLFNDLLNSLSSRYSLKNMRLNPIFCRSFCFLQGVDVGYG